MLNEINYCGSCQHFLGCGDWNLCCNLKNDLCYKHTESCDSYNPIDKLTEKEFVKKFCHNCGSQRCEGVGTEWFNGCRFKDFLINDNPDNNLNDEFQRFSKMAQEFGYNVVKSEKEEKSTFESLFGVKI